MGRRQVCSKRAERFVEPAGDTLPAADLDRYAEQWLLENELGAKSPKTIRARRLLTSKLSWFLREKGHTTCGTPELRAFLGHIANGHEEKAGRWGETNQAGKRQVRPRTILTYFTDLRTFFRFLVSEGALSESPVDKITRPANRPDQIRPFTEDQVQSILGAARRGPHPTRDEAILLFLLDTGARASEVAGLRVCDLDIHGRRAQVLGKGNKHRSVFFGATTARMLFRYLNEHRRAEDDPVFLADGGFKAGEALEPNGLLLLVRRLGKAAGLTAVRCSPHTFRHTFAVTFLRAGGNTFTLQQLLGHTSLAMTMRYVALAQADLEGQHRQFSPVEQMGRNSRKGR